MPIQAFHLLLRKDTHGSSLLFNFLTLQITVFTYARKKSDFGRVKSFGEIFGLLFESSPKSFLSCNFFVL